KARERHRNRDALLQDKIRAQQQEKSEQEGEIDESGKQKPSEVIVYCAAEFHDLILQRFNSPSATTDGAVRRQMSWRASISRAASSGCWKLMMPLIGRLSVNMWTISMPARSMSCIIVFTREER